MNSIIYKYPLQLLPEQWLTLPKGAKILSVQEQWEGIMLWAIVDTDEKTTEVRRIIFRGTGTNDYLDPDWIHLATVLSHPGYVWHIFEDAVP